MPHFLLKPGAFWLACCFTSASVLAQTASPDAARARQDAERIQQQEQQRLQQEREREQQKRNPGGIDPKTLQPPVNKAPSLGANCRDMPQIVINGAANLPSAEQQKLLAPYLGKCLGVAEIERLLAAITAYYIERGFITTRVYVPSQDLSKGRLELLVVEGVVEKILLKDNAAERNVALATAFPALTGRVLNLRDIEQGLDQINRLASNSAKMQVLPGSKAGGSVVAIENETKPRFKFNASLDNQGSSSTGKRQAGLGMSLDNALGWGDFFSYMHRQSVPADRARRYSSSDSLSYVLPYGYNTLSLNASRSHYASTIMTPLAREFGISGDANNASIRFERVLFRNQRSRFNLAATLTAKDSKNYLAGELLNVSSRKLSVLDLDANLSTGLAGGVLGLDLGWARGLQAFGALRDVADLPDDAPRAQFGKFKYGVSYSHPFKLAGKDGAFSSQLTGQRAQDGLYGSEQILIGGIYSVRGFSNQSLSGDHGYVWRNDVSVRLPMQILSQSATVKPYLALDHGHVSSRASGVPGGSLSGMALGCTLTVGPATWEIFNSRPLSVPQGMPREGSATYFRLALSI